MVRSGKMISDKKIVEKALRPTSPVHVHVDNETPVHFHVQTSKKNLMNSNNSMAKSRAGSVPKSRKQRINSINTRKSSTKSRSETIERSRSVSPGLPNSDRSPARSARGTPRVSWTGATHTLELNAPRDSIRSTDSSPDEKSDVRKNMKNYVEKIDTLMDELGTLKNEVQLQKSLRDLERREDELDDSHECLKEQEEDIRYMREELSNSDMKNEKLRNMMDKIQKGAVESKFDNERVLVERERLKKKLIEVEHDGKAATRQIYELRDVIRQLHQENTSNSAISQRLSDTRGDLLDKLSEFEKTNRSLREMLKEQHANDMDTNRQREQVEVLLLKISEYESRCQRLSLEVLEKDRSINELQAHVQGQLSENLQMSNCVKSLESVKGHLQKQLKMREGDTSRLNVQIRALEQSLTEANEALESLQHYKQRYMEACEEKEGLKKACRIYKEKSDKSEETIVQLNEQLEDRDTKLTDLEGQMGQLRGKLSACEAMNAQVQLDNDSLTKQIDDLEQTYKNAQVLAERAQQDLMSQIATRTEQLTVCRSECEKLKTEAQALRASVDQYEALVEEYKAEMQRTRQEAEMTVAQLEHEQLHNSQIQKESQLELQQLKERLQMRLHELEPLPAMLETTELRLQNNQARLAAYEHRNHENTSLVAELSAKLERQSDLYQSTKEKGIMTADKNRSLCSEVDSMDRKVNDAEARVRELTLLLTQRDQSLLAATSREDDINRENQVLTRQLENALADLRRQGDQYREKSNARDRSIHSRICDLEQDSVHLKAENIRLKRERDELEQNCKSRVTDLNDRLEQSYGTNRSMQNYVAFLKSSYGNVFGDIFTDAPPCSPYCAPKCCPPKCCP